MLRITVSKGGRAAVNYFKDALSRQDYYSEHAKVMGQWYGKTAARLGLPKEVSEHDFEMMVSNRNPLTGEKITVRDSASRRAGYDFTFNAPKSVSIVEAITKDEAIRIAHRTAVRRAMQEVEKNMQIQVGQGKNKHYEVTGNLVYASFEHDVSRPVEQETKNGKQYISDPHLHEHAYVINATYNENKNRYQAIEIGNIKRNGQYYEALYHNYLAHGLQEAGYQIERTKSSFEIKGIERKTIEKFSNRTLEIEKAAKEKGLDWAVDKAELGTKTRHNKHKGVTEAEMKNHWSERLSLEERFAIFSAKGADVAASGLANEKKNAGGELTVKMAIDQALQHYMERKSAVPEKQVLGYALKLGVDRFRPEDIQAELDRRKGTGVFSGRKNSDTYITTKESLLAEENMKAFAVNTRSKFTAINPEYEPERDFLNEGQKEAIRHALTSNDQVIIVSGAAGVGKTTLMKEVKSGVEASGKKIFAFAPSADASRGVLREKGFEGAETIKKLLDRTEIQDQLKGQIILIDEAGMIGNQTMNGIFEIARKQEARVILSGDWHQHQSVDAGDALRQLETEANMPVSRVSEVVRQKDKINYRKAVQYLSTGNVKQGFETLERMDSIIEIEDRQERYERIAEDYLQSVKAPRIREKPGVYRDRTALVVSPTHREGRAITHTIREKLKSEGMIGTEEHDFEVHRSLSFTASQKQDFLNYQQGMAVQFHKNLGTFKAGSRYNVVGVSDHGKVMLQDEQNKSETIALPLQESVHFEVYQREHIAVAKGDRLRITGNGQSLEKKALNNGEGYKIKGFTKDGNILLENGQTLNQNYRNFTLGYYRTSHSSQGKDADDLFLIQSSTSFAASNDRQFYVSVSRGVERCFIYTDNKESLKWAVSQNSDRMSASEVVAAGNDQTGLKTHRRSLERQQLDYYQQSMDQSSQSGKEQSHESPIRKQRQLDRLARENAQGIDIGY